MESLESDKVLATWKGAEPGGHRRLGMMIFLVSLSMFFAVGITCFLLYRLSGSASAGMVPVQLPIGLWFSTALLALTALCVYRTTQAANSDDFASLRIWVLRTWVLGALFVAVQIPSILQLLRMHSLDVHAGQPGIYGMTFALVLLHALHVAGGLVPLTMLAWKARTGCLDRESLPSVRACAAYWHFLEIVWAVLLATLVLAG
jgi:heme/copper-type cytochrome/quinol oxidase subunit 3